MPQVPPNLTPARITQLFEYTGADAEGYFPYAIDGNTYKLKLSTALDTVIPGAQGTPTVLAVNIPTQSFLSSVKIILTSGYSTIGKGPGVYVNDAFATSGLAAAHPRFCKQSADGRYWRLVVEGGLNVLCAGAAADNTTDDGPAFTDAIAYLAAIGETLSNGFGTPRLFIPWSRYYLGTTTLDIHHTCIIEGEAGGGYGNAISYLRWGAATTGIRTHRYNTTGATGTTGAVYPATNAVGILIRNLTLYGGYAGTESESHGIHIRETTHVENVFITNFAGDGIYGNCTVGGGSNDGQASGSHFANIMVQTCRNGYYFDGVDSNSLSFFNCRAQSNRRYGAWHVLGLSINWFGGLFATNGTGGTPTMCNYNGFRYYVLPNQAAGASTNSPKGATVTMTIASPCVVTWTSHGLATGTAVTFQTTGALPTGLSVGSFYYATVTSADTFTLSATLGGAAINTSGSQSGTHKAGANANNTWWGVQNSGGSHPDFPTWTSGLTWRDGGAFRADGAGQSGYIFGAYWEGDHAPFIIEAQYTILASNANGAFRAVKFSGATYEGRLSASASGVGVTGRFDVAGNIVIQGNALIGSQDSGVAADGEMFLDSTNVYNWFRFRHGGTIKNTIMSYGDQLYLDTTSGGFLRQAGNAIASFSNSGLLVSYTGAKLGYDTGAGDTVTQATSRTTGVTINKACGAITLVSAAGSTSWQTFTVTNSVVAAGDVVEVSQKSGADKYMIHVTAVAAGSFAVTFATTGGTTTEQPVFNFAVLKAVTS